jgi:hypothetical protein
MRDWRAVRLGSNLTAGELPQAVAGADVHRRKAPA